MKKPKIVSGLQKLFNRRLIILVLILAQLGTTVALLARSYQLKWLEELLMLFSVVTAMHLLIQPNKSAFKLSLIFLILLFPVFGGVLYWILHSQTSSLGFRMRLAKIERESYHAFDANEDSFQEAVQRVPSARKQLRYMRNNTPFPVYRNTQTSYYPDGGAMLRAMLADLASAERYIFLEYFIIAEGKMWGEILDVLCERVRAGVDVRLIYDDIGSMPTLPPNYAKKLRAMGIRCEKFNPFHPFLTSTQNNRDHRKIAVIDGKIAYTGGINLADEYIGEIRRFGIWKDNAIRLCGEGAWALTVIFLQTWSFLSRTAEDFLSYRPEGGGSADVSDGWVQPYSDSPMDNENVGEQVYAQIIDQTQRYLYITTPYLMVDDGMIAALRTAAKSGVDVRIITPEIPDKRTVLFTTRSYYRTLLEAGVKIYEFRDGFIHAKTFLSDDTVATVGTVNLDFRSLYLHFECGVCLYRTRSIEDIKHDFLQTLEVSRPITLAECKKNIFVRFFQSICRIFAPLM